MSFRSPIAKRLLAAVSVSACLALPLVVVSQPADARSSNHSVRARYATFCDVGEQVVQVTMFNPATTGGLKPFAIRWDYHPSRDGQSEMTSYLAPRETYLFEQRFVPGTKITIKASNETDVEFATHLLVNKSVPDLHCK